MKNRMFNQVINRALCLIFLLILNGCSANLFSTEEESQQATNHNNKSHLNTDDMVTAAEYQQHLQEWKKLKPSINRLVAIEGELNVIFKQLNDIIENQKVQPENTQINNRQNENYNSDVARVSKKNAIAPMEKRKDNTLDIRQGSQLILSPNNYAVQLFSLKDRNGVQSNLTRVKNKHPALLSNLPIILEDIVVGNSMYYRVKAGIFDSQQAAESLCKTLQSLQTSCVVGQATGVRFSQ